MWRLLYPLVLVLAWPLVRLRLWRRGRREPAYRRRIGERFGRVPTGIPPGCVWFHTVSAGETVAAAPLIADLMRQFPDRPFLVTTMTPTGSDQVGARLGDSVHHCYAPYDFPWAVRRFFATVQPRLLVLMETELWPNLIEAAHRRGVPVLLVNARLSARSARGYRRLGGLTRRMLGQLDAIACQYPDHADRFVALGAPAERVHTLGSVKFDQSLPASHAAQVEALRQRFRLTGGVWVAGSTHDGEEEPLLAALRRLRARHPGVRLVLVPRHPVRAGQVAAMCRERGLSVALHSQASAADPDADVVVVDVMGVLLAWYGVADVAFVGGSLVARGGHNPIEPALCGAPVLMGPSVFNFEDVVAPFRAAGSLTPVADADDLTAALVAAFDDPPAARARGDLGRRVVADHVGATARLRELIGARIGALGGAEDNRPGLG